MARLHGILLQLTLSSSLLQHPSHQETLRRLLCSRVFYLHNNAPGAAIKRFKSIIENYKNSNLIPETLYRLCEAFLMIGLETEAKKSQALLIYNFSDSKWKKLSINLFNSNKNDKDKGIIVSIKDYVKTIFD